MINKEKYICRIPFNQIQIFENQNFLCCPSWLTESIGNEGSVKEIFYSKKAENIRNSILDGSYKYCSQTNCPNLSGLENNKISDDFILKTNESIVEIKNNTFPKHLNFNFDKSCNFKCPSCRKDYINFLGEDRDIVDEKLKQVDEELSHSIEKLYISGSADPFYSKSFRKFLIDLNPKKYPKLRNIHIHTNGSLWTEELWAKMKNIHKYINTCEISIDAGTKETYEEKVRLGGNWEVLQKNLSFFTKIKTIKHYSFSFVVQDTNYTEMYDFYKNIESHFKGRTDTMWECFYGKIVNWGTYTPGEFLIKDVTDTNHPEHHLFINELSRINNLFNFNSNLNHLYKINKKLI